MQTEHQLLGMGIQIIVSGTVLLVMRVRYKDQSIHDGEMKTAEGIVISGDIHSILQNQSKFPVCYLTWFTIYVVQPQRLHKICMAEMFLIIMRYIKKQIHQEIILLLPSPSSITTGPSISTVIVTMRENQPRVDDIVIIAKNWDLLGSNAVLSNLGTGKVVQC